MRCSLTPTPDGTTSHSTKPASGQVAGYLPEGEGLCPLSLRGRVGEGETDMASFIISGGKIAMPVRTNSGVVYRECNYSANACSRKSVARHNILIGKES